MELDQIRNQARGKKVTGCEGGNDSASCNCRLVLSWLPLALIIGGSRQLHNNNIEAVTDNNSLVVEGLDENRSR